MKKLLFSGSKRLDFALLLSLIAKVGSAVTGLVTIILLARVLTIQEMSLYVLFFQAVRFLTVACSYGLPNVVQKYAGIFAGDNNHTEYWYVVIKISAIFTVAATVSLIFFQLLWPTINNSIYDNELTRLLSFVVFLVGALRAVELIESAFFRAKRQFLAGVLLLGFPRDLAILIAVSVVYFYHISVDVKWLIWLYMVVSLIIVLWGGANLFKFNVIEKHSHNDSLKDIKNTVVVMVPMYAHALASVMYQTSDIWILGIYGTANEVATYGAISRFTALLLFILSVVNLIIPSIIASMYAKGKIDDLEIVARGSSVFAVMFALPVVLIYWFGGEQLITILLGKEYVVAVEYLKIISVGAFVSALVGSPGVVLQMTGHHTLLTRITLFTLTFNLVLNIIVVGDYGALGVSYVTSASLVLQNVAMAYAVYYKLGVKTYPFLNVKSIKKSFKIARAKS